MSAWLIRILPVVVRALALCIFGVLIGALAKWLFNIPDEVAFRVGQWIVIASLVPTLLIVVVGTFRSNKD